MMIDSVCVCVCSSCKQQQDLLSFLAVVLGLDNPAVNRLRLTWEVWRSDITTNQITGGGVYSPSTRAFWRW